MTRLDKVKLKRLFVDERGEYTDVPKSYEFVKEFMVNNYEFSPNDNTFREFYEKKYVYIITDYRYLKVVKKVFTLGKLFGISDHMLTPEAYKERGYTYDEIKLLHDEIIRRRKEHVNKFIEISPPVDEKDSKNLIYKDGKYIDVPLSYDIVSSYIVKYQNFNKNNEDRLRDFYDHNYVKTITEITYYNIRNKHNFGKMFNVYSATIRSIRYWQERGYSTDDAKDIISKLQSQTSESSFVKRHGEEKGRLLYNSYIKDHSTKISVSNKRVWKQGRGYAYSKTINPKTGVFYTKDETFELQKENSIKGAMVAKETRKRRATSVWQKQYWMNLGYDEQSAIQQVKKRMPINNIEYYIEKYGPDEGTVRYKKRIEKYKNTCNSKSNEEKAIWNVKKVSNVPHGVSRAATMFFDNIRNILDNEGIKLTYMYGDKEFYIKDDVKSTIYFYDCYIKECNMLIEFNGIKFHPNPDKMSYEDIKNWRSLFYCIPGDVQFEKDKRKKEIAEENGYNYIVVWEDDNIESVVSNIVNEIKHIIYA